MKKNYFLFPIVTAISIFAFPCFTNAAILYMVPESESVRAGQTFTVTIDLDSESMAVNAASLDMKYDTSLLSIQSVGYSQSIFSIWAEEPKYSNSSGNLHLSGGRPSPGWNGANGAIVSVTFRAKKPGQTMVTLQNGSVLANDGLGTDVLSVSKALSVNIGEAASVPVEEIVPATDALATTTKLASSANLIPTAPILSNIPDTLNEGDTLSFTGNSMPNVSMQVYIQKGKYNPDITQITVNPDGSFAYTFKYSVRSGYYKIWAINILPNGTMGPSSQISYVEVVNGSTLNIGGTSISLKVIVLLLTILSILLIIALFIILSMYLRLRHKKFKEVKEAKETLHKGFDTLKTGLNSYVKYLIKSGSISGAKKREEGTKKDLDAELTSIEKKIEKGINDIKKI
ncbi:MAG: cohesin domain-containing protein [Candidatus Taylorbacteria bacterium]